jgi:hypothetical protein
LRPLRRVGRRFALGEALLGLQQPVHHQQLAHQVVEGCAGGLPVRVADRLDQQRVRLALLLEVIRLVSAIAASLLGWLLVTAMISMGPKAARSRRRAASSSSSTSGTRP